MERQEPVDKEQAKPVPQKGNGNPLMFWRSEDKTNLPEDLSLEEPTEEEPKGETLEAQGEPDNSEICPSDDAPEAQANSSDSKESNKTADSGDATRTRKNTTDSATSTEATDMSKEDVSVDSCSEQKADACNTPEADEPTAESVPAQSKPTPMNHLMFWRKSEPAQAGNIQGDSAESPPNEESEIPSTNANIDKADPSENSGFRMPFWNPRARLSQTPLDTDATGPVTTIEKDSAASGDSEGTTVREKEEKDFCNAEPTDETLVGDTPQTSTVAEVDVAHEPEATPDSETTSSSAIMVTSGESSIDSPDCPVEDATKECTQAAEKPETASPSENGQQGESAAASLTEQSTHSMEEAQSATAEQNGPMKQMSRFFSNPFSKGMES